MYTLVIKKKRFNKLYRMVSNQFKYYEEEFMRLGDDTNSPDFEFARDMMFDFAELYDLLSTAKERKGDS